jgi:uncharacterized protein (TIGR03118 family)
MKNLYKVMIVSLACLSAFAQDTTTNSYTQTNLVSDTASIKAVHTDPNLKNPWGLSRTAASPWWVSDQVTGVSTLYDGTGTPQPLIVTIPSASGTGTGSPSGTAVLNGSFVFVTLDGTISEWTGAASAVIKVNHSASGAIYTGCTVATNAGAPTLYVANASGGVEAYNKAFQPVTLASGAFVDPNVPTQFTPYGIQSEGSTIYVTFGALGLAGGYADAFNTSGKLLLSFEQGWFDAPWGIARAPKGFGKFAGALLVGNVTSGKIGAYNAATGKFEGFLLNPKKKAIAIPGLWAIYFGGGTTSSSGPKTSLFFSAGVGAYAHGLFGTITAP